MQKNNVNLKNLQFLLSRKWMKKWGNLEVQNINISLQYRVDFRIKYSNVLCERSLKIEFLEFLANLPVLGYGCGIGWVSLALPLLKSDETPLTTGKLSIVELSWIGSILSMGSLTGNLIFGVLVNFCGTKTCILLSGILQAVDLHISFKSIIRF